MRDTIEQSLSPLDRVLFRRDIEAVVGEVREVQGDAMSGLSRGFSGALRRVLEEVESSLALLRRSVAERRTLESRFAALNESLAASGSPPERQELMLEYLALITSPERIDGDRKAFRRYMGLDCVTERHQGALEEKLRREEILVKTLGALSARCVGALLREHGSDQAVDVDTVRTGRSGDDADTGPESSDSAGSSGSLGVSAEGLQRVDSLLKALGIERFLLSQVRDARRWQNRVTAFRAIGSLAAALPPAQRARLLSPETSNFLVRCCLDQDENIWIQRGALELLCELSATEALRVLERRLLVSDNRRKDDLFVRGHAVSLLPRVATEARWTATLTRLLARPEPSEYVRIQIARTLAGGRTVGPERLLLEVARGDETRRDGSPRVRAAVAEELRRRAERDPRREEVAARVLAWLIRRDEALLTRRVALEEAAALAAHRQRRARKYKIDAIDHILLEAIDEVCKTDPDAALRRLAEEAREAIIVRNLPAFPWVEGKIAAPLAELDEGRDLRVRAAEVGINDDLLGRVLAYFTRDDFGIVVDRRGRDIVFQKGDRIARRLWRVMHEVRNLDSAKRQAFRHTTGRVFRGAMRVHPGLMAELMETKVPGERLWNEGEQSWRRFLPLVDDYLSLFAWRPWRRQRTARIFSSQGVTEIVDPQPWWRRMAAHLRMSWRYASLAGLRNAHARNKVFSDPSKYVQVMREEYGFETRFYPAWYVYEDEPFRLEDATLAAHFVHGVPPDEPRAERAPGELDVTPTDERSAEVMALAEAEAASEADRTPDEGSVADRTPLEVEMIAPAMAAPVAPPEVVEPAPEPAAASAEPIDEDSIDALLRPLVGAKTTLEAGDVTGIEDTAGGEADAESVSGGLLGSGSGDAAGESRARAAAAQEEDTQDELERAASGKVPPIGPPAAQSPDDTMLEIPGADGVDTGDQSKSGSGRLGSSDPLGVKQEGEETGEEPAERPALDVSTADFGSDPGSAGEIPSGGVSVRRPLDPEETGEEVKQPTRKKKSRGTKKRTPSRPKARLDEDTADDVLPLPPGEGKSARDADETGEEVSP